MKILLAIRKRLAQFDLARMIPRNWAGLSTLSLCPKISLFQYVTKNGQRTVVRQVEGGKLFLHMEWQRYFGISSLNNSSWGKLGQRSGKLWHGEARVGRFLLYLTIMGIKRACQRVTFGEATELSALQRYAFKIPQDAVGATSWYQPKTWFHKVLQNVSLY